MLSRLATSYTMMADSGSGDSDNSVTVGNRVLFSTFLTWNVIPGTKKIIEVEMVVIVYVNYHSAM